MKTPCKVLNDHTYVLVEVWVLFRGPTLTIPSILGVFPTARLCGEWHEHEEGSDPDLRRTRKLAFQRVGEEERATLLLADDPFPTFTVSIDYDSGPSRRKRELLASAWGKLSPEERAALNLTEPAPV